MKITVWQQFSSNHSSRFTIVGVFNTLTVAENAAAEIRGILQKIQQWHEDNPEKSEALYEEADGEWPPPLSEIEKGGFS